MKPGIYAMSSEKYHRLPFASSTSLRTMMRASPLHAWSGIIDSESPSLRLGTAVHAAVLEPEQFGSLIRVEPKVDRRTKDGKQLWESFEMSMMPGQTRISEEQLAIVNSISRNVEASTAAQSLLKRAPAREMTLIGEVDGVTCKIRCDAYGDRDGLVLDLKTTSHLATAYEFERSIGNFGYAIQAAFYAMVLRSQSMPVNEFAWIACETSAPHGVRCFRVGCDQLVPLEERILTALHQWSECETANTWPSYPDTVCDLELSPWILA